MAYYSTMLSSQTLNPPPPPPRPHPQVSFDVIAVEADGHNPEKDSAVIDLLQSKVHLAMQ